jgi:hypothetical protein
MGLPNAMITPNPDGLHQFLMVSHAQKRRSTFERQSAMVQHAKVRWSTSKRQNAKVHVYESIFNLHIFSISHMTEQDNYFSLMVIRLQPPLVGSKLTLPLLGSNSERRYE